MRLKSKKKSPNGGYSLIELVVTILISSVVVMAVVGFLTTGLRHYRNINGETVLQMESQVADLFITELFQEAQEYHVIESSLYSPSEPEFSDAEITYAVSVKRDGDNYVLALNGSELWFAKAASANDEDRIKDLLREGRDGAFLAKHVSVFSLNSNCDTFSNAWSSSNGLLTINLRFAVDTKTYTNKILVTLRNSKTD